MKSRAGRIAAALVLLGLAAFGLWMWYGQDYRIRFTPEELQLEAAVAAPGGGGPVLTVRVRNRGRSGLVVADRPDLGPPFDVLLLDMGSGKAVRRTTRPQDAPEFARRMLRTGEQYSLSVGLDALFGRLPDGSYSLRVTYDTRGPAERGERLAGDLDVGEAKSGPATFEVRGPSRD